MTLTVDELYILRVLAEVPERRLRCTSKGYRIVDVSARGYTYRVRKAQVTRLVAAGLLVLDCGAHELSTAGRAVVEAR